VWLVLQSITMPLECSVGVAGGCAAACCPERSVVSNWPLELHPKRPSTHRPHNARWDADRVFRTMVLHSIQYSIRPMAILLAGFYQAPRRYFPPRWGKLRRM
jgi:hypothetical protein